MQNYVVVKEVDKEPAILQVESYLTLETMQKIVGGYVEVLHLEKDYLICFDEEGRLKDKPLNVQLENVFTQNTVEILGTLFICKGEGEEMVSMPYKEAQDLMKMFIHER